MATRDDVVTTVFVDIEDSTGIANYFKKKDYEGFLKEFHETIAEVSKGKRWKIIQNEQNYKFMGDEFIAFLPHKEMGHREALQAALYLAATLKYTWYFSSHNNKRVFGDKEPIELNIGINTGDVSQMPYPVIGKKPRRIKTSYEGFPITLAKRIQSVAEESQSSRIIVADRFFREYNSISPRSYEFHYLGQRTFKGIAQKFSCYEWTGDDFYVYLDFPEQPDENIERTLSALYDKNPHNPWYAALLANYYFALGEEEYWKGKPDNKFYRECARVCNTAIHNITKFNLRKLNELLFDCLELTKEKWEELSFRTEQAYNADPTFARALALRAKSLLMLDNSAAERAATELTILFKESKDFESLFIGHFVLARYYSTIDKKKANMMKHMKAAVRCAREGKVDWAYGEYFDAEQDFIDYKDEKEFNKQIAILKRMWEEE